MPEKIIILGTRFELHDWWNSPSIQAFDAFEATLKTCTASPFPDGRTEPPSLSFLAPFTNWFGRLTKILFTFIGFVFRVHLFSCLPLNISKDSILPIFWLLCDHVTGCHINSYWNCENLIFICLVTHGLFFINCLLQQKMVPHGSKTCFANWKIHTSSELDFQFIRNSKLKLITKTYQFQQRETIDYTGGIDSNLK